MGSSFSLGNRFVEWKKVYNSLIKLDEQEEYDLANCEEIITGQSALSKQQLVDDLLKNPKCSETVFKFSENSKIFSEFCEKNEFAHLDHWGKWLQARNFSGEAIKSVDGATAISVKEHYIGAFLYRRYLKFIKGDKSVNARQADACLAMACDVGVFKALHHRCLNNLERLKVAKISETDKTEALTQFDLDTKKLAQLHWSPGLAHAANFQLDLANFYLNSGAEWAGGLTDMYHKRAAQCFLYAKKISTYSKIPANEKEISLICGEEGLAIFKRFEDDNWDKLQTYFLDHVKPELTEHATLVDEATKQVAAWLSVSRQKVWGAKPEK
jgi:hypothetical protein